MTERNSTCVVDAMQRQAENFLIAANLANEENGYDLSKVAFSGFKNNVIVGCAVHGDFEVKASRLVGGVKCPSCNQPRKIKIHKTAFLYVLRCYNAWESFYKIGITTQSVGRRYSASKSMPYNYQVISLVSGPTQQIIEMEKKLLSENRRNRYNPTFPFRGQTECFTNKIFL